MKYRILWKRKGEDKACGWGEPIFNDRETARQIAEQNNKKYPNLFHWIEKLNHEELTRLRLYGRTK